jgi:hypothetical protein
MVAVLKSLALCWLNPQLPMGSPLHDCQHYTNSNDPVFLAS